MVRLAEFEGITVSMDDGCDLRVPHVHVSGRDGDAVYDITDAEPVRGVVPGRAGTILEGWLVVRERELLDAWDAVRSGFGGSDIPVPPLA